MVAQGRLHGGTRLLYLTRSPVERLSFLQDLIASVTPNDRFVAIVAPQNGPLVERALALADRGPAHVQVVETDAILAQRSPSADPAALLASFVDDALGKPPAAADPQTTALLYVELDPILVACGSNQELLSSLRAFDPDRIPYACRTAETACVESLSGSIPSDFFTLHDEWRLAGSLAAGVSDGMRLDQAALDVALTDPGSRRRYVEEWAVQGLATAGNVSSLPRPFAGQRSGLLYLDRELTIRSATPRAAVLLGRDPGELEGEPVSACLEGVDLLAVRRECARAGGGSPFVVSWRLGPGIYEPLQVVVDPAGPNPGGAGIIVSVAPIEKTRGSQAVYREMKSHVSGDGAVEDAEPVIKDEVTETLSGTKITKREHEILLLVLAHHTIREVSRELDIAEVTVKKHLTNIYRKLRVSSRTELLRSFGLPGQTGEGE